MSQSPRKGPGEPTPESVESIASELPIGLWVGAAPRGELLYANQAYRDIIGIAPRPEILAGSFSAAYQVYRRGGGPYPEDELPFARVVRTGSSVTVDDLVIRRADGRSVDIRAWAKPRFDHDGVLAQVLIVFADITREVRADQARSEAERRLRWIIDSAPLVLFALDSTGRVTLSEGRGLEAFNSAPGQLVGQSAFELYKDIPEVIDNTRRALQGESFSNCNQVGPIFTETTFSPLRDESGALVGTVGISLDVTQRERMRRQLELADRMAAIGALAAGVGHEINNPLTYVVANLELLERSLGALGGEAQTARHQLSSAREGLAHVRRIVQDLASFSRPKDQKRIPVRVELPIRAAIRMAAHTTDRRAKVLVEGPSDVWAAADEGQLAQVILNLILNAARAVGEGRPADNEIRVNWSASAERVRIDVADTGGGIPAALMDRIFDPFFTTRTEEFGTGLGLSVSKSIVESLGGTLTASSAQTKGSVFSVELHRADAPRAEHAPAMPQTVGADGPGRRILIIDDNANLGRTFRSVLTGHQVELRSIARDALELLARDSAFDLILCDVMLGDMEVRDFYAALKNTAPAAADAVQFMTGGAFTPAARSFLASVPNKCHQKPFDVRAVVNELGR